MLDYLNTLYLDYDNINENDKIDANNWWLN